METGLRSLAVWRVTVLYDGTCLSSQDGSKVPVASGWGKRQQRQYAVWVHEGVTGALFSLFCNLVFFCQTPKLEHQQPGQYLEVEAGGQGQCQCRTTEG